MLNIIFSLTFLLLFEISFFCLCRIWKRKNCCHHCHRCINTLDCFEFVTDFTCEMWKWHYYYYTEFENLIRLSVNIFSNAMTKVNSINIYNQIALCDNYNYLIIIKFKTIYKCVKRIYYFWYLGDHRVGIIFIRCL